LNRRLGGPQIPSGHFWRREKSDAPIEIKTRAALVTKLKCENYILSTEQNVHCVFYYSK